MVRSYRRKTKDKWTKNDLLEALTLIREKKSKVNDVAKEFGISRATLYRQSVKFKESDFDESSVLNHRHHGGTSVLTPMEEDVLEKTVIDLKNQEFEVTSADVKRICFEYCHANNIANKFDQNNRIASDDWYYGFIRRHPIVKRYLKRGSSDKGSSNYCNCATTTDTDSPGKSDASNSSTVIKKVRSNQKRPSIPGGNKFSNKSPGAKRRKIATKNTNPESGEAPGPSEDDYIEMPVLKREDIEQELETSGETEKNDEDGYFDLENALEASNILEQALVKAGPEAEEKSEDTF